MPRKYGRRAFKPKRRYGRKRYVRKRAAAPRGHIRINRRLPEMFITNSSVTNTPVVVDTTGSCLQLGAPVPNQWGTYDLPFTLQFMLSQVLNNSDIVSIADKYKIKSAYVRIFFNSGTTSVGSAYSMPQVYHIIDQDDSTPITPAQLREKMGVKYKTFKNESSYIGIKVRPVPNMTVYNTALSSGYAIPSKSMFLDCNSPSVPHYGVKGVLTNVNLPATSVAQVGFKFDISVTLEARDIQ